MIKIIFCLRRLSELTPEAFQRYWLEQHAPMVRSYASALNIRRYTQSHTFFDPRLASSADARAPLTEPYDGVAEIWWDSIEQITAAGDTREGRAAGRALLEDERKFIDLSNSPIFFAEEHDIIPFDSTH
jgi:uncharacterized protein (TIGR02118 family)